MEHVIWAAAPDLHPVMGFSLERKRAPPREGREARPVKLPGIKKWCTDTYSTPSKTEKVKKTKTGIFNTVRKGDHRQTRDEQPSTSVIFDLGKTGTRLATTFAFGYCTQQTTLQPRPRRGSADAGSVSRRVTGNATHGRVAKTNLAVVRESTEWGDVLDREVSLRRSRADVALLSDPVDLLVELYVITHHTKSRHHRSGAGAAAEEGG